MLLSSLLRLTVPLVRSEALEWYGNLLRKS